MGWGGELDPPTAQGAHTAQGAPFVAPQANVTYGVAEGLRQARSLADQVAFEQSEAGRSYQHSPLSLGEEGGAPPPAHGRELEPLPEDDPLRDPVYSEPSGAGQGEADYRRLFDEKSGLVDKYADHTAAAVAAGQLTWDEAYRLLNEYNYTISPDGKLVVAQGHLDPGGLAGTTAQDARAALFGDRPGEGYARQEADWLAARRAEIENFFRDLNLSGQERAHHGEGVRGGVDGGHADMGEQYSTLSQFGYYIDADGEKVQVVDREDLEHTKEQRPGDFPSTEAASGDYGYPPGSWEDEVMRAIFENPLPTHSDEDIADRRRSIREANTGVYQEALRAAGYQNLMMGGSPEMMMGVQADTMRRVGTASAQQELAEEVRLRTDNFNTQFAEATRRQSALQDIALKHLGTELGEIAHKRMKDLSLYQANLQKNYAAWAEDNLGPEWYEAVAAYIGKGLIDIGIESAKGISAEAGAELVGAVL